MNLFYSMNFDLDCTDSSVKGMNRHRLFKRWVDDNELTLVVQVFYSAENEKRDLIVDEI